MPVWGRRLDEYVQFRPGMEHEKTRIIHPILDYLESIQGKTSARERPAADHADVLAGSEADHRTRKADQGRGPDQIAKE
jgi:hypothetical protein